MLPLLKNNVIFDRRQIRRVPHDCEQVSRVVLQMVTIQVTLDFAKLLVCDDLLTLLVVQVAAVYNDFEMTGQTSVLS